MVPSVPLGDDGLIVQAPLYASDDVPLADYIISAMDVADGFILADDAGVLDDASTQVLPDEQDNLEVRGVYLYRVHVKPTTLRYSPYEVSEMRPWSLQNI